MSMRAQGEHRCRVCTKRIVGAGRFCSTPCLDAFASDLRSVGYTAAEVEHSIKAITISEADAAALADIAIAALERAPTPHGHCPTCKRPTRRVSRSGRCEGCAWSREKGTDLPAVNLADTWEEDEIARAAVARNPDGLTLEQVGGLLGVTRERVRQIELHALGSLRVRCKAMGITAADLAHALAHKPEEPILPSTSPGRGTRRTGNPLSPAAAAPSPKSVRIALDLEALERCTTRLSAWGDILDELDRVRAARSSGAAPRTAKAANR